MPNKATRITYVNARRSPSPPGYRRDNKVNNQAAKGSAAPPGGLIQFT